MRHIDDVKKENQGLKDSVANLAKSMTKIAKASSQTEEKANKAFDLADIVKMKVAQEEKAKKN